MAERQNPPSLLKVRFEQSGGFAGLVKGCDLDADLLPPEVGAELRRLVAESGLTASTEASSPGGRDRRQYAITIERDDGTVRVCCDDGCIPEGARPLVAFLVARARPTRP